MQHKGLGQGYFSVLRYRRDVTRDEARNIAVILVFESGGYGRIRARRLDGVGGQKDQTVLDALLSNLVSDEPKTVGWLRDAYRRLQRSLYLTEPREVAGNDPDAIIDALYKAYVEPRQDEERLYEGYERLAKLYEQRPAVKDRSGGLPGEINPL